MTPPAATRRERLRAQTLSEIREHAHAQLAAGGASALSLNGIARAMGMSGAAMYRYFDSRDALLSALISESYEDLAQALADALTRADRRTAEARLRATLDAYRGWALAQPHRYRLIFASVYASGAVDPERIVPASQRAMDVILRALEQVAAGSGAADAGTVRPASLARALTRWGATTGHPDAPPARLLLAQQCWTRLHGLVSLEIEGVFAQMGLDPDALYGDEVGRLVDRAAGGAA